MFECIHCGVSSTGEAWDKMTATVFIGSEKDVDMIASIKEQEPGTIHICPSCKEDIMIGEDMQ